MGAWLRDLMFTNILPSNLDIRFSVEELSYLLLAIEHEIVSLQAQIVDANDLNDTLFDVSEARRRIAKLNRSHRAITESIDL